MRNHFPQECISYDRTEIRVDTGISTSIKAKYNKQDVFILDKEKKEILIIEVEITSYDNLRTVELEKKHKDDMLANHCGSPTWIKNKNYCVCDDMGWNSYESS